MSFSTLGACTSYSPTRLGRQSYRPAPKRCDSATQRGTSAAAANTHRELVPGELRAREALAARGLVLARDDGAVVVAAYRRRVCDAERGEDEGELGDGGEAHVESESAVLCGSPEVSSGLAPSGRAAGQQVTYRVGNRD